MKDLDLAYCAGLIDGEGHVAVIDSWRRGLAYKEPRIAVQMTDVTVVEHLRDAFGCGSICYPKTAKAHHIPTARWAVSSRKAYHVAVLLEPFLRVKKQGARAIIDHYGPAGQGQKPDRYSRGESHHEGKLTWAKVQALRAARDAPRKYGDVKRLAIKYGIAESTLRSVWRNEIWIESCSQLQSPAA